MAIYTFFMDYQGGTYICQKAAGDLRTACFAWKEDVVSGGYVPDLNLKSFSTAFDDDIDELPPAPLDEVRNVWLFHLMLGGDMLDLHIVQTDTETVGAETRKVSFV